MTVTVEETCETTHVLTYHIDAETIGEAKEMIRSGTVDYREREWTTEDNHKIDYLSIREVK